MVVVVVGCNGDLRPDYVLNFLQNSDRVSLSTRNSEKPRYSVVLFIAPATFPIVETRNVSSTLDFRPFSTRLQARYDFMS